MPSFPPRPARPCQLQTVLGGFWQRRRDVGGWAQSAAAAPYAARDSSNLCITTQAPTSGTETPSVRGCTRVPAGFWRFLEVFTAEPAALRRRTEEYCAVPSARDCTRPAVTSFPPPMPPLRVARRPPCAAARACQEVFSAEFLLAPLSVCHAAAHSIRLASTQVKAAGSQ